MLSSLLIDKQYIRFVQQTHPHLLIDTTKQGAPFYTANIDITEVLRSPVKRFISRSAYPIFPGLTRPRMTIFGLPFEPYIQTPIIDRLPDITELLDIGHHYDAQVVGITNVNPTAAQATLLERYGFLSLPSFPAMTLTLNEKTFDDYIQKRPAKSRRDIRRNMRKFAQAGHKIIEASNCRHSHDMIRAYRDTYRRAKIKWLPYSSTYFADWSRAGAHAHVFEAQTHNGKFLGFVNMISMGRRVHVARLAVDNAWHRRDAIFFNLLYRSIQHACELNANLVMLGPTAYRTKRRLGAEAIALSNYFLPISTSWKLVWHLLGGAMARELSYMQSMALLEESL